MEENVESTLRDSISIVQPAQAFAYHCTCKKDGGAFVWEEWSKLASHYLAQADRKSLFNQPVGYQSLRADRAVHK